MWQSSIVIHSPSIRRRHHLTIWLVVAAHAWSGTAVIGKEIRDLDADRDAFMPTTITVEPGHALVETADTFIDNREGPETHTSRSCSCVKHSPSGSNSGSERIRKSAPVATW